MRLIFPKGVEAEREKVMYAYGAFRPRKSVADLGLLGDDDGAGHDRGGPAEAQVKKEKMQTREGLLESDAQNAVERGLGRNITSTELRSPSGPD